MGEKNFSARISRTKIEKAREGLANAKTEKDRKYFSGLLRIALDDYEGRKDGGMNAVPSKYEGFSKLPEGVQEKIDPKLAKKYKTGGMSKAVMKARGGTFKGTF